MFRTMSGKSMSVKPEKIEEPEPEERNEQESEIEGLMPGRDRMDEGGRVARAADARSRPPLGPAFVGRWGAR